MELGEEGYEPIYRYDLTSPTVSARRKSDRSASVIMTLFLIFWSSNIADFVNRIEYSEDEMLKKSPPC